MHNTDNIPMGMLFNSFSPKSQIHSMNSINVFITCVVMYTYIFVNFRETHTFNVTAITWQIENSCKHVSNNALLIEDNKVICTQKHNKHAMQMTIKFLL